MEVSATRIMRKILKIYRILPPTVGRESDSSGCALSRGVESGSAIGLHHLRRDAALAK